MTIRAVPEFLIQPTTVLGVWHVIAFDRDFMSGVACAVGLHQIPAAQLLALDRLRQSRELAAGASWANN